MAAAPAVSSNEWNLQFSTTRQLSNITPGNSAVFDGRTTFGHPTPTLLTGPRPGLVRFDTSGFWY